MCSVSAFGEHYRDKFTQKDYYKQLEPWIYPSSPGLVPNPTVLPFDQDRDRIPTTRLPPNPQPDPYRTVVTEFISKQEFDELKKEVEEMKAILLRAKKYDEETNQHHCHMEEKVELIKKIAELVGVDLGDVFDNHV